MESKYLCILNDQGRNANREALEQEHVPYNNQAVTSATTTILSTQGIPTQSIVTSFCSAQSIPTQPYLTGMFRTFINLAMPHISPWEFV